MLKRGTEIQFKQMCDFTGKEVTFQGEIVGYAAELRKMWPEECATVVDPAYLVKRKAAHSYFSYHMIFAEEIVTNKEVK